MKFFETLSATGINEVSIQVKNIGQETIELYLTTEYSSEDGSLKETKSISLTGTPEEIDAKFFNLISTPLSNKEKAPEVKAKKKAVKKVEELETKEELKATEEVVATVTPKEEEPVAKEEKAPVVKEVKINNEKVLKDFMTSIKADPILTHKDKIEELYANLNQSELDKPFAKKTRIDLDIAIRKEENIQAARAKHGFTAKVDIEELASPTTEEPEMSEQVSDIPNVEENAGAEKEQPIEEVKEEIVEKQIAEMEVKAEAVVPTPVQAPVVPQYEEVKTIEMISTLGTYDDYKVAGWNDEQLVEHGHAKFVITKVEIPQAISEQPQKLSYTFPKAFDAEEN